MSLVLLVLRVRPRDKGTETIELNSFWE